MTSPRIWALLGAHRGDNNQVLALARATGLPFEVKALDYNPLYRVRTAFQPASLLTLTQASRALLAGQPPDLVIAINRRSVPIVRALKQRSRGRLRSVHLGNPRVSPAFFDLVFTTPQYPVPDAPNIVRIPIALGPRPETVALGAASAAMLADLPRPRRLLSIGGPTKSWQFAPGDIAAAIATLATRAAVEGGSVIVVGSPRTPAEAREEARTALATAPVPALLVPIEGPPSYPELLGAADEIHVTADSVSMISEAIATGKPVGLMAVQPSGRGARAMARQDRVAPGIPMHPNDLRYFWTELERRGWVGTVSEPRRGNVPDVLAQCAALVRALLDGDAPPLPLPGRGR